MVVHQSLAVVHQNNSHITIRNMKLISCAALVVCLAFAGASEDKKQEKRGLSNFGFGDGGHASFGDGGHSFGGGHNFGGLDSGVGGGYGGYEHHPQTKIITNTIPVPKPYPVPVEKKVLVPVHVPVDKPYPVHIPKPYPVHVEKAVPYKVDKPIPYPVKVPVKIPVVKKVEVPVEKPYPVPVDKPYPVPVPKPYIVEKKVPIYIHAKNSGHSYDSGYDSLSGHGASASDFSSHGISSGSYSHDLSSGDFSGHGHY